MALGGLFGSLFGGPSDISKKGFLKDLPYPRKFEKEATIVPIIPKNWLKSFPYQFRVIKNAGNTNLALELRDGYFYDAAEDTFDLASIFSAWKPFNLTLNPESITQDENFAINVTATQSGTVSEHNGIVFRDLVISGTTGVHPRRGLFGADKYGDVTFGGDARSGYEEFHLLRNYFRAYAEAKRRGEAGLQLIFVNRKDNESLIVEPVKFTMKRSASRATLYDYNIVFKVIGNQDISFSQGFLSSWLTDIFDFIEAVQEGIAAIRTAIAAVSALLSAIEGLLDTFIFGPLRQLDLALTELVGLANNFSQIGDSIKNKFSSSATLNLLTDSRKTLDDLKKGLPPGTRPTPIQERYGLGSNKISFPTNIQREATKGGRALIALGPVVASQLIIDDDILGPELAAEFELEKQEALAITIADIQDLQTAVRDLSITAAGAFNIGSPEYDEFLDKETPVVDSVKVPTNEEIDALYYLSVLDELLTLILSFGEPLVTKDPTLELARINEFFSGTLNQNVANSVLPIQLNPGVSLESLAVQFLGNAARWTEIATLNNLKPPYIDENSTSPSVLKPGDKILIPSPAGREGNINTVYGSRFTDNLSETEKQMGVDIRLNDEFDFVVGSNNDFQFATAGTNLKQSIKIKLSLSKGDLLYHQNIGVGLLVGQKNLNPSTISEEIESVILSDERVARVLDLQVIVAGNAINIKMRVQPRGDGSPIPIDLNL